MSQNELTTARLRELIAAARKGGIKAYPEGTPYTFLDWSGPGGRLQKVDADLIVYLVNNAPALADTQDKADLLEWLGKSILNGWTFEWNPHQGMFEVLNDEGRYVAGSDQWIDALRAAKEASRG